MSTRLANEMQAELIRRYHRRMVDRGRQLSIDDAARLRISRRALKFRCYVNRRA